MRLSFQFEDFFRDVHRGVEARADVNTPTFLVEQGVMGGLRIRDLRENLLSDQDARVEIKLEGSLSPTGRSDTADQFQASCGQNLILRLILFRGCM